MEDMSNFDFMKGSYRCYCKPVTVNAKMRYCPTLDSIVYVEGRRSIKVERWQIEYYADILKESLNVSYDYMAGYFELIRRLLEQPLFWEYFSEEERTQMLDKIIDEGEFADHIHPMHQNVDKSGLYVYDGLDEMGHYRFIRFKIGAEGLWETLERVFQFMNYRDRLSGMEYDRLSNEEVTDASKELPPLTEKDIAMEQLKQQVFRLLDLGVTESEILTSVGKCMPSEVFKLVISSDYKIRESRFHRIGNKNYQSYREIKMAPLDKAVYILFLKHPEGINFSYLPDYRSELMEIYKKLMNYRTTAAMLRSVEDVTDPTKNSINEKCARIRRAFVEAFGEYKAAPYCISGPRGEAKRIALDRKYVDWVE